jgi:hypothetical protein
MSGNVIPYRMQQMHGCYANEIAFSGYLLSRQSRYLSAVVSESSECQESMYASETALFEYFHPAEAGVTLPLYGEISDFGALKNVVCNERPLIKIALPPELRHYHGEISDFRVLRMWQC